MNGILSANITGSVHSGIDCHQTAGKGARAVVVDVNVEEGEATVRLVEETGGEAMLIKVDVSQAVEVESMVKKAVETYGRLDYAFNNAGIIQQPHALTADVIEETWNNTIRKEVKNKCWTSCQT